MWDVWWLQNVNKTIVEIHDKICDMIKLAWNFAFNIALLFKANLDSGGSVTLYDIIPGFIKVMHICHRSMIIRYLLTFYHVKIMHTYSSAINKMVFKLTRVLTSEFIIYEYPKSF